MVSQKLTRQHWLEAAFRMLTRSGPSAIKAEAIARDLGVSKGSFYWHFKDVPALKSEMLTYWKEMATRATIVELDRGAMPPAEKLEALVFIATGGKGANHGGPMSEAAIRDWARYDTTALAVLEEVDAMRLDYVEALFREYGLSETESGSFARLLYSSLIGLQALSYRRQGTPKKELSHLLSLMLN